MLCSLITNTYLRSLRYISPVQVVFCMDRCIEASPGSNKYRVLKAECLALLRRYQEAQEIAK